jgi:hypothetical protein
MFRPIISSADPPDDLFRHHLRLSVLLMPGSRLASQMRQWWDAMNHTIRPILVKTEIIDNFLKRQWRRNWSIGCCLTTGRKLGMWAGMTSRTQQDQCLLLVLVKKLGMRNLYIRENSPTTRLIEVLWCPGNVLSSSQVRYQLGNRVSVQSEVWAFFAHITHGVYIWT